MYCCIAVVLFRFLYCDSSVIVLYRNMRNFPTYLLMKLPRPREVSKLLVQFSFMGGLFLLQLPFFFVVQLDSFDLLTATVGQRTSLSSFGNGSRVWEVSLSLITAGPEAHLNVKPHLNHQALFSIEIPLLWFMFTFLTSFHVELSRPVKWTQVLFDRCAPHFD